MTLIPLSELGILGEVESLLFSPASRTYVFSLLGTLPIAWLLLKLKQIQSEDLRSLLDKRIWLHPSARRDYLTILMNALLRAIIYVPVLFTKLGFAAGIYGLLKLVFIPPSLSLSWNLKIFLFSVVLFIADDFSRFVMHWLQHRISWLWYFHRWHHSAEVMTPLTLLRTHPIEMLIMRLRSIVTGGTIIGLFFFLFGGGITGLQILGVDAIGFIFNAMGANLRHSHVRWSYGKFERIFISPAQHQKHHDRTNTVPVNLGSCLAIWDLLAGSFRPGSNSQTVVFGLSQNLISTEKNRKLELEEHIHSNYDLANKRKVD